MNKILTALIILGILILAFFVLNNFIYTEKQGDSNTTFCTMEALLCPDGSYVSRSGDKCQFSACPAPKDAVLGKLRKSQDTFDLLVASPLDEGETTYVVPLKIADSNTLDSLINKQVTITGRYAEGNLFEADTIKPAINSNPEIGEIRIGEEAYINGLKITVLSLIEDSRCPIDAVCIQAGQVRLRVLLRSNTDKDEVIISSDKPETLFDSFKVSLIKTEPSAKAAELINQNNYIFTFKVSE